MENKVHVFSPYFQFHTCNACGYRQIVKSPGYDKKWMLWMFISTLSMEFKTPVGIENISKIHSINLMISQI